MKINFKKSTNYGFTLIELMVTLSVASILLSVAVPSYRSFVQDTLLITQSNSFYSALALAKGEAIKRNALVRLCPSTTGTSCVDGGIWSNGWIIFVDSNSNRTVDAAEQILQVTPAFTGGNTIIATNSGMITFRQDGFSPGSAGTYSVCDARGSDYSKSIVLSQQGRFRSETGITGSCS